MRIPNNNELNILPLEFEMTLQDFLRYHKRYPVIAITWPAGVGKSTVTSEISKLLWAQLFTELPDNNPCLKVIRETNGKVNDITLWGNNQNYFLATDATEIIKAFIQSQKSPIIFDFALTQPFIFSDMKLSWEWLHSFNEMFRMQFHSLPKPDIVIELQADSQMIIERLAQRGKHIDEFVIQMTEQLNGYYKQGIVPEKYEGENTEVLQIANDNTIESIVDKTMEAIKKAA